MKTILFETSKAGAQLINKIVTRAMSLGIQSYSRIDCDMDITACHCNGMPLDLERLLAADDFNFAHDVLGIRANINRETGEIENCFVPRFAAKS